MGRSGGRLGLVGLTAFLALDVLLVALALHSTSGSVVDGGTTIGSDTPPSATSSTRSAGSSTGPGSAPTTAGSAEVKGMNVVPLTVGVVAVGADTAFRFRVGSCDSGGSTVELTRNGGASWGPRSTPFDTVTRIKVRSDGSSFAVGANGSSGCRPAIRSASALDADWSSPPSASGAWYRDPRDSQRVGLRSGGTGKPCRSGSVVDLAVVDAGAAVLCANGDVRTSVTGSSWDTAASVSGAVALAQRSGSRVYLAVPGAAGCAGIAIVEAAAPDSAVGCAPVELSAVEPGAVALSLSSDSGWLLVGDQAYRSNGALKTWKKV